MIIKWAIFFTVAGFIGNVRGRISILTRFAITRTAKSAAAHPPSSIRSQKMVSSKVMGGDSLQDELSLVRVVSHVNLTIFMDYETATG